MTEILKYTIKEKIEEKVDSTEPKLDKTAFIRKICQRLNMSESHFRKIINYKLGDDNEIYAWQMRIIAEEVECTMEDLFTKIEQQPEAA